MNRYLHILFSILFASQIHAQDLNQIEAFADTLFIHEHFSQSAKEYQRAIFFSPEHKKSSLYFKAATCYILEKEYAKAANYFDYAYFSTPSDSLKQEAIFLKTACYLYLKQYQFALGELYNLPEKLSPYNESRRWFYFGMIHFGLENFELSKNAFLSALDSTQVESRKEIENIFSTKKNLFKPNPVMASLLSMVFPGSGQLYAGNYKNAFNSLVLTGIFFSLGINISMKYGYVQGIVAVFPWFFRYYQGGYEHAQQMAEEKREERRNNSFKNILSIIANSKNKN